MTRRTLLLLFSLVLLATATTAMTLSLPHAAGAAQSLRAGLGYRGAGGDFVGFYVTGRGEKVYCLDPRKALPQTVSLHTVGRYGGVSRAASQQLAYALDRWGDARTASDAAVESQVLNSIVGNRADVARRARALPHAWGGEVAHRLQLARLLAGPYRVQVRLPRQLLPGQSAQGSVMVLSAAGHALPGATVQLSGTHAQVPRQVRAGAGGRAVFRYEVTDVGEVSVTATAAGLPGTAVQVNAPPSWQQHLVHAAGLATARSSASFRRTPGGFSNSYSCDQACDGRPLVTLRVCAEASAHSRRMIFHAGPRRTIVDFSPSARGTCRSVSVQLADRDHVDGFWEFRTRTGWTAPVRAGGGFTVDCPGSPPVAVSLNYDCTTAQIRASVAASPAHSTVLVIGGPQPRRIVAAPGATATFAASVSCAQPTTYTLRGGVQRANGSWHYGPVSVVQTPHR